MRLVLRSRRRPDPSATLQSWINMHAFDSGKIRVSLRDGIPLIEVYHNGELELADVEWAWRTIRSELLPPHALPVDVIIDRKGNYSLSVSALGGMEEFMRDADRVAYVVYSTTQEKMTEMARYLYLAGKLVGSFHSQEEAQAWIERGRAAGPEQTGMKQAGHRPAAGTPAAA